MIAISISIGPLGVKLLKFKRDGVLVSRDNALDVIEIRQNFLGTFGQFIYDFNCILDSRGRNYDIILQLGYTSSSIWNWMFPKKSLIVTNMDGLEWKRDKYSRMTKSFLHFSRRFITSV